MINTAFRTRADQLKLIDEPVRLIDKWRPPSRALLLRQGNHDELSELCHQQLNRRGRVNLWNGRQEKALFYLALSHYYRGDYAESRRWLAQIQEIRPYDTNARYLAADIARVQGQLAEAWAQLEILVPRTRRPKTWLYMAQLVDSSEALARLRDNYRRASASDSVPPFHPAIAQYLAAGYQRASEYAKAFELWQEVIAHTSRRPTPSRTNTTVANAFRTGGAAVALKDINRVLRANGMKPFLVSGTLLGCVREGKLLAHDNDIDIGLMSDTDEQIVSKVLAASGYFHLLPRRAGDCLRVKHLNGIAIDVFLHYSENDAVWHGGTKARWYNSPFRLTETLFLGERFWIPEAPERYLEENYGDWRTPIVNFDSTLDTPNAEIRSQDELVIHAYKKLNGALLQGDDESMTRYRKLLVTLNEPDPLPTSRQSSR
ncbi:LicD family protein [Salinicola sp. CPA57]|uniref:tetratricopeptide repeat protein n=1 Tax=Salinicola sp. CPA57 TaxID=1949080 RepID=UPI000DA15FC7|nr:LicD family protein [Salinicola sp. CPA57]